MMRVFNFADKQQIKHLLYLVISGEQITLITDRMTNVTSKFNWINL